MDFKKMLSAAQAGDLQAQESMPELYKSLLVKKAVLTGVFDEDLYRELCITLLDCICKFRI